MSDERKIMNLQTAASISCSLVLTQLTRVLRSTTLHFIGEKLFNKQLCYFHPTCYKLWKVGYTRFLYYSRSTLQMCVASVNVIID